MLATKIAAIVTFVGLVGLVLSSLFHATAASDFIFNTAAVCLVGGPLIFFSYVMIGLCIEFASINQEPEVQLAVRGPSPNILVTPVSHVASGEWIPEGLRRAPKGPLNRSTGRGYRI